VFKRDKLCRAMGAMSKEVRRLMESEDSVNDVVEKTE